MENTTLFRLTEEEVAGIRRNMGPAYETSCNPDEWMNVKVGDIVKFGMTRKNETNNECVHMPIGWKVLAIEGSKALLITDKIYFNAWDIDGIMEHNCSTKKEFFDLWEDSFYRANCQSIYGEKAFDNQKVYMENKQSCFTEAERKCILETELVNRSDDGREVRNTKDHLFLLSLEEYCKYFEAKSNEPEDRIASGYGDCVKYKAYVVPNGVCEVIPYFNSGMKLCYYALRDMAKNHRLYSVNVENGEVHDTGINPGWLQPVFMRPAMWVDIEACKNINK